MLGFPRMGLLMFALLDSGLALGPSLLWVVCFPSPVSLVSRVSIFPSQAIRYHSGSVVIAQYVFFAPGDNEMMVLHGALYFVDKFLFVFLGGILAPSLAQLGGEHLSLAEVGFNFREFTLVFCCFLLSVLLLPFLSLGFLALRCALVFGFCFSSLVFVLFVCVLCAPALCLVLSVFSLLG